MKATFVLGLVVLFITLVIAGPLFTIAALNTLFGLGIPYTFWTWLSMFWVGLVLFPSASVRLRKD